LRFLYQKRLEKEGFEVAAAKNGTEGLAAAESIRPHVILLDLLMPVMSGADMLARLRSQEWGGDIHVIVLTNVGVDEAPPMLRSLNVDRYIVKAQYTPAQVVAIVYEVLGIERGQDGARLEEKEGKP